jgi:hypothetical protein
VIDGRPAGPVVDVLVLVVLVRLPLRLAALTEPIRRRFD